MKNKPVYKMVSFDIWGTLLKSNPLFVQARTLLFAEALSHSDLVKLKSIKDEVDIELDRSAETTGRDEDFTARMNLMIEKLEKRPEDFHKDFLQDVRDKLARLFIFHLPEFIEEKTIEIFKELKKRDIKIALLSNTGFLHGDTMRPALTSLGILEHVDHAFFSNEVGFAKPHGEMYDQLLKHSGFSAHQILHVGDSIKADYNGAWNFGISALLFDPKNIYGNRMASIINMNDLLPIIDQCITVLHYKNMSLHSLSFEEGIIVAEDKKPFDLVLYSKFKYGDGLIAKQYGHQLAKKFIDTYPELFDTKDETIDLVITTSPYKSIVKGSSGIVKGFKNYINQYLFNLGKSSVVDIVILKKEMFQGDYGSFTDEQRKRLMHKNDLYVMADFIKGKRVILIDDARITGSHENNLVSFLKDKDLKDAFFLYIADMEIDFARVHPDIESVMNHGWMDNLSKLSEIMESSEFILNARVCKYILSQEDQPKLKVFFTSLKENILYDLYNGMVGDGYSTMDLYKESFMTLQEVLIEKGLIIEDNFNCF